MFKSRGRQILFSPLPVRQAVWQHQQQGRSDPATADFVAAVRESLTRLRALVVVPLITTQLVRCTGPMDGQIIEGSQQDVMAYFDAQLQTFTISEACFSSPNDEKTLQSLTSTICRAIPCLSEITRGELGGLALKKIMQCSLSGGPQALRAALEELSIRADLPECDSAQLRPGDLLPDEAIEDLVQSMSQGFEVHAYVAVHILGKYYLGVVQEWSPSPTGTMPVVSLTRLYTVMFGQGNVQNVRHMDLFNIKGQYRCSIASAGFDSQPRAEFGAQAAENNGSSGESENARALEQVKDQLRQMSDFGPDDYKNSLRRLFLTWHPDKAGNTDFANMMFRMIKRHGDWYQDGRPGDDAWLDEYSVGPSGGHQAASDPAATQDAIIQRDVATCFLRIYYANLCGSLFAGTASNPSSFARPCAGCWLEEACQREISAGGALAL